MDLAPETKRKLLEKLDELADRHREVETLLADPELAGEGERLAELAREHGRLARFVELRDRLQKLHRERRGAREVLEEDPELAELAAEEIEEAEREEQQVTEELLELLLTDREETGRDLIVEIRSGAGGEEAALFAADLLGMYERYAERHGWQTELMEASTTDLGGMREAVLEVSGPGAYRKLRYESGVHRVQRVPRTESQGRIHTSTATVAVLPQARPIEVQIDPGDIEMSFQRSSGPGGQHVNKTSSSVRLVHTPTGIAVRCQDEKSQRANRKKAMKILRARLYEQLESRRRERRDALRKSQIGTGDRNERIRTYNFPQDRITDHRVGVDVFGVEDFLTGNCDELFDALAEHDKQRRLEAFAEAKRSRSSTGR